MGFKLTFTEVNELFSRLSRNYKIFAPKRFEKQGRYSDTDIIKYSEINTVEEIVFKEKSTYAAKEVITPLSQTLYYYTGDTITERDNTPSKEYLIFGRPCDINAQKRQDKIYLENGFEDKYYKNVRDKVKFVCIECIEGFDTCFCVTMQSNKTDDYALAVRVLDDGILFDVKDPEFKEYFNGCKEEPFELKFIDHDNAPVRLPDIPNEQVRDALINDPMWAEKYNGRCVQCGSCTVACSTCTCYTTRDIIYDSKADIGERKRVNASCHISGFDEMAGGHKFRTTAGEKMRYKVMHKIYDYKEKFGDNHMCVGCGRCTDRCPQYISMSAAITYAADAADRIKKEGK